MPQNYLLIFVFLVISIRYSPWVTTLSFSFHVCSFFNSELKQSKVNGAHPPFLETLDRNLLVVAREIQYVITLGLLQQWLQHLLCSRLV